MKKIFKSFSDWCNANKGLIEFMIFIVAIITVILDNLHLFSTITILPLINKIIVVLNYGIKIPIYLILVIMIICLIYFRRLINRYKKNKIDFDFLVGKWHLEYDGTRDGNPVKGNETLEITNDGKYLINNVQKFVVGDFKCDELSHQITFTKTDVSPANNMGKLKDILYIINNEQINGVESGSFNGKVGYRRIN